MMAITLAFEQFSTLLRENLPLAVNNLHMDMLEDALDDAIDTFESMGPAGRDESGDNSYEAREKVKISRGGMIRSNSWEGNTITGHGDSDDLPIGQVATAKAPDPEKVPLTRFITLRANLKRITGNVTVNMTQIIADLIADSIEDVALGHMEDAVFQVRKQKLAWAWSDGTGMIATTDGSYTVTNGSQISIGLKSGPYNRFIKSQRYVFYSKTGWPTTTTRKGGIAVCTNIDDTTRKVEFEMEAGESDAVLVVDDIIVREGSLTAGTSGTSLVPTGVEEWFKATGAFYGIADITKIPELIAYIEGDEAALVEPEPDRIAKLINRIKKAGQPPPQMLISESALSTQYSFTEKQGFATYPVPGRLMSPNGGVGMPIFTHGDLILPWRSSEFIRPGMLLGFRPDSVKAFSPGGVNAIRWWFGNGPGAGMSSIFFPVSDGKQVTELFQAPFDTWCEFMSVKPKSNFRRIGLITQETA